MQESRGPTIVLEHNEEFIGGFLICLFVFLMAANHDEVKSYLLAVLVLLLVLTFVSGLRRMYKGLCRRTVLDQIGIRRELRKGARNWQYERYVVYWGDVVSVTEKGYKLSLTLRTRPTTPHVFDITKYMIMSDFDLIERVKQFVADRTMGSADPVVSRRQADPAPQAVSEGSVARRKPPQTGTRMSCQRLAGVKRDRCPTLVVAMTVSEVSRVLA